MFYNYHRRKTTSTNLNGPTMEPVFLVLWLNGVSASKEWVIDIDLVVEF